MRLDLPQRREVKDERLGQLGCVAEPCRQPVAELDGAQRVEPRLHQRRVGRHTRQQLRRHLADHRDVYRHAAGHRGRREPSSLRAEKLCEQPDAANVRSYQRRLQHA